MHFLFRTRLLVGWDVPIIFELLPILTHSCNFDLRSNSIPVTWKSNILFILELLEEPRQMLFNIIALDYAFKSYGFLKIKFDRFRDSYFKISK